jgi:hypothetical protein
MLLEKKKLKKDKYEKTPFHASLLGKGLNRSWAKNW